jgi:hypothetical protein
VKCILKVLLFPHGLNSYKMNDDIPVEVTLGNKCL